jgi:hypothetical protein
LRQIKNFHLRSLKVKDKIVMKGEKAGFAWSKKPVRPSMDII